ncbi:MAG: hypothetical protein EON91_11290 [Brevundimonas sp.]|uniref:hypothetical protein n=1 Tax=Brevundimonas sp. TaxID=1871086 RepID=UPI001228C03C|nr:hypothetical protein [Brevundimonas sp.]RZJ16917.1 MAG: hypothetical protein EON91_11290 [Brevundimonas sp.]
MRTMIAGLTAALALTAGAAQAQEMSAADQQDIQCFALVAAQAGEGEQSPEKMASLATAMMFYLGRMEGRSPNTDWLARIETYLRSSEVEKLPTHAERCATEMMSKGKALIDWGARLQAQAGAQKGG